MPELDQETYNKYKKTVEDVLKKVINYENRPLPANIVEREERINAYKAEIVESYNNFITYVDENYERLTQDSKESTKKRISEIKLRLLRALVALNLSLELPSERNLINIDDIVEANTSSQDIENTQIFVRPGDISRQPEAEPEDNSDFNDKQLHNDKIVNDTHEKEQKSLSQTNSNLPSTSSLKIPIDTENTMAPPEDTNARDRGEMSRIEFIRFCSQAIKNNYSGDPLALNAFINAVKLVETISEGKFDDLLKTFLLTKLEGKALESINQDGSVENIIADLKKSIKPDSSKVISGRMLAMKLNKLTSQEYASKAEELADSLQRSLVIEGITREKAKEMAIEKTVEMCRQSAKTDLVRSVLAAATFNDPKEVIAKLITEQATNETERQILAYRAQNNKRFNKFNNNNRNFAYNSYKNGQNGPNSSQNGNRNQYHRRNGYSQNNNRQYHQRGRNGNNNGHNSGYNVRVAENATAPLERRGNEQDQQQASVFTLERVSRRN